MLTLEQIRVALQDRRLGLVAESTGLHYNTVRGIASGENVNPTYAVLKAISDYLTEREVARG
jgi:transcriptional regulator with XRE-family HTH domain